MYHQIADPPEAVDRLAVSPAAFADQLACLHEAGFTTLTASALAAALAGRGGRAAAAGRADLRRRVR